AGFFVGRNAERRILLCETRQRHTHLFLIGLRLGFHSLRDHRLGELHLFKQNVLTNVAQGFTGGDVFQPDHRSDVACQNFLDFSTVVGVHLQDAANTFLLALDRVVDGFTCMKNARVDAHEGQLTDERVGHQLERERRELRVVIGRQADGVAIVVHALNRGNVHGGRQVVDDRVEHALNALVLEGGAAQQGLDCAGDGAQTQTLVDLGFGEFTGLKILVHQVFVGFGSRFNQLFTPFLGFVLLIGGNVNVFELGALAGFVPDDRLHLDEVDHSLERVFCTDGPHDGHGVGLQTQLELVIHLEEVGTGTVHLVDERQTGNPVLVRLAPYSFRLGLNTAHSAIHHHGAVEHTHGTFNFNGEVHVSRGVDDVDAVLGVIVRHPAPEGGRGSGRNGDAALLLLFHPVHGGRALMGFAKLVVDACIEQNALGRRGFSGVDVSGNTDVTVALDWGLA